MKETGVGAVAVIAIVVVIAAAVGVSSYLLVSDRRAPSESGGGGENQLGGENENQLGEGENENEDMVNNTDNNAASSEEMADIALSSGTKIIDQTGDWVSTGNTGDNPSFYQIDFVDIKEVDVSIDENNLYVKAIFNGQWPKDNSDWPSFNGDQITDIGFTLMIDSDNNPQTGCQADGGTEINLDCGARMNVPYGNPPGTWNGYRTNPSGIEFPEDNRYLNQYIFDYPMIGGPGYDYVTNVYPLEHVQLTAGQVVTLKIKTEAASDEYHHAAFDDMNFLNGPSESELVIRLGENTTINFGSQ